MDLTDLETLRAALRLAGLTPHTSLDQHFLVDRAALEQLLESADLQPTDTVLEIGAGPGVITQALAERVKAVVAVELDPKFAALIQRARWDNVTVVNQDFRNLSLDDVPSGYKVVAGLPYGITSLVLQRLLSAANRPLSITVMVQKEVAQRVTAEPGALSVLALSVQYYGQPRLVSIVPATSYYPVPKVDSAILHIDGRPAPAFPADEQQLFRLIKIGFAARRKMLKNNLAAGLQWPMAKAEALLTKADIKPTARAQELSLDDWHRLYRALHGQSR